MGFPSRIASSRFVSILTTVVINIASDRATRESPGSTTLSERPGRAAIRSSNGPMAASAAGKLSPGEAAELMGLVAIHVRMFEVTETEAKLAALEEELEKRMPSP